jgi:hypothetical protein
MQSVAVANHTTKLPFKLQKGCKLVHIHIVCSTQQPHAMVRKDAVQQLYGLGQQCWQSCNGGQGAGCHAGGSQACPHTHHLHARNSQKHNCTQSVAVASHTTIMNFNLQEGRKLAHIRIVCMHTASTWRAKRIRFVQQLYGLGQQCWQSCNDGGQAARRKDASLRTYTSSAGTQQQHKCTQSVAVASHTTKLLFKLQEGRKLVHIRIVCRQAAATWHAVEFSSNKWLSPWLGTTVLASMQGCRDYCIVDLNQLHVIWHSAACAKSLAAYSQTFSLVWW